MSSIKVADVNEEARQSPASIREAPEQEVAPVIEEAKEEVKEPVVEDLKEPVEETNEEAKEEAKVKTQDTNEMSSRVKTQDKLITCPKCNKTMKTKSYRYNHEKICQGNLTDRPVKPKTKPKPEPVNETIIETPPKQEPPPPPSPVKHMNPLMEHYQRLQQDYMKQKHERFNNLFQGMVNGSRKKR